MNCKNLRLVICYSIYGCTLRDEHSPIRTVLTDVTLVYKKKLQYCKQIRLTVNTLNQRIEVASNCLHKHKYKPKNHQPNETPFNTNRVITVTYNAALYLGQYLKI